MNQDNIEVCVRALLKIFAGQPPGNQYSYNQKWLRVTDLSWLFGGLSDTQ